MKQTLHNLRVLGLAAALLMAAAPAARAWTAQQLFPSGTTPGYEAVGGNYVQRSLPQWSYGMVEAGVNSSNTNQIIILGMFEGMFNAAFTISESGGKTYATLVPDAGYNDFVTPLACYGSSLFVNRQVKRTFDAYAVDIVPASVDIYGNYREASQWRGEVTKEADGSISIFFNQPLTLQYCTKNYNAYSGDSEMHFNSYQVKFFPWNATVSDRYYITDGSEMYYDDRSYKTEIHFFENNTFTIANWSGFGQGIETVKTSSNPNVSSTFHTMEGYMVPETGKVYMKMQPWMHDVVSVTASTSNVYNAIRRFELRPLENPSAISGLVFNTRDVEGTVTFGVPQHENENDLWAAPHGNLRTTANTVMEFEPFGAYSPELKAALMFRIANTKISCPTQDVTLELKHESLTMVPGTTDDNLLPVNVTASFSVAKNDMFVESFDVYLVEGSSPKGAKTIFLGNVSKNSDNFYKVGGQITLPTPDGKPWNEHKGESHSYPYSLKAVAHYAASSQAPAADGKRMAAGLSSSNHGLGSSTLNFTVGVAGIDADDIEVKATQTGLLVAAPADVTVEVYDMSGRKVAEGVANTEISLGAKGVFVVKVANRAFKLMK